MAETLVQMRRNLDVFEDEEHTLREAVLRLRELLLKADQKRDEAPDEAEKRRWNAKIDELEASLAKAKSGLNRCGRNLLEYRLKIAEAEHAEITSEHTAHIAESFARETKRVLSGTDEPSGELNLQEAALVRSSLAADPARLPEDARRSIESKVQDFAEKPSASAPPKGEDAHPRTQLLLREALEKCVTDRVGELTFAEMDLVATCYDLIDRRVSSGAAEDRMMEVLSRAVLQISERCAVILRLRRQIMNHDAR